MGNFEERLREVEDRKVIKIIIHGGVVIDVENLPDGYMYEVIDED